MRGPARCDRDERDRVFRRRCRSSWRCERGCHILMLAHDAGEHANELPNAVAGDRADLVIRIAALLRVGAQFFRVSFDRRIQFRSDDDTRLRGERLRICLELAGDRRRVLVGMIVGREIDEMHEHGATLDVPQELIAEPVTFVRAFDQAGDIGDDERLIVISSDDTEVRNERREGIVGDLRLRRTDDGDERRLAGVRKSDQSDVGDQLQLDGELALFTGIAVLCESRRLSCCSGKVLIAPSAAATPGDEDSLAVVHQLRDQLAAVLVANHGADRKLDGDVFAMRARAVRAHAVLSASRFPLALKLEVIKRIESLRRLHVDRSAVAAVTAGRAALRYELFSAERDASVAAVAGLHSDACVIDEHRLFLSAKDEPKLRLGGRGSLDSPRSVGMTPRNKKRRSASGALEQRAEWTLLGSLRRDRDEASTLAFVVEVHDAVDLREERVIAADADIRAGIELRSALAHDDRSAGDELSGEALHAEHFRLRVAAVAR